jgi:hypothetical protein
MAERSDVDVAGLLQRVVAGDLGAVDQLQTAPQPQIVAAARSASVPVTRAAVVRVLRAMRGRQDLDGAAQRWASFVLRGYVAGGSGPIEAADIAIEPDHEQAIVDVLVRLDELGDRIDGRICTAENDDLIASLESSGGSSVRPPV